MYRAYSGFEEHTFWHGRLSIQAFPCSCPGGTQVILKLRTYKDDYYVFTQVNYLLRGTDVHAMLALAVHDTLRVVSHVP